MTHAHTVRRCWLFLLLAGTLSAVTTPPARATDSAELLRLFADPPATYSTAPFWVWNDDLTDETLLATLHDLTDQNIHQLIVHPRPGLMTPYLGTQWFDLWKKTLQEAQRLDVILWIYDENSYPSGFAGGHVPDVMPESRGRGLVFRETDEPPQVAADTVAIFQLVGDTYQNVTDAARAGNTLPAGRYLIASVQRAGNAPWYGGRCYVDLLYPGVTQQFLDVTLTPYERLFQREFGRRIPGVFTDEPHIQPAGWPWTDDLPARFQQRWGYSLIDSLPSLEHMTCDWKRVQHNYHQLLLDLFIERWAQPYYEYCAQHHLEFTGHYWEHEWPNCQVVPDNMALAAWQQRPGIDTLMNEYDEGPHAQFGNVRAVKELASLANQLDRSRTLCEAYGAAGWDLRFEDMKRIGDWLNVLGINTLNQHLSYISIRGMRKRDHPSSFSYHEPWWPAYHVQADYFARLSAALSQGEEVNSILFLEPTTTAWMYQTLPARDPRLNEIGASFQRLVTEMAQDQVEFDLGCEDVIARHGTANAKGLRIGQRTYDTVVIPPFTENLNSRTAELLAQALEHGTRVLCCGDPPERIDGQLSDRGATLARHRGWSQVDPAELIEAMPISLDFDVTRTPNERGPLYHQRRQLDDGELVFLANASNTSPATGTISSARKSAKSLDLNTGRVEPYPCKSRKDGGLGYAIDLTFDLPPCGSLLLLLSDEPSTTTPKRRERVKALTADGPPRIDRIQPNVLTLDFVDVEAHGQKREAAYVLRAADFVFKQNGLDRNPWEGAVQFRDEIIAHKFPPDSGFEAVYHFTIRDRVPPTLVAVVEQAERYTITCNGHPVAPTPDAWWLDRAFGRLDIPAATHVGDNELRIAASPFTIYHELEAAYLLGDFTLESTDHGFAIAPAQDLTLGPWNTQGHPFYSAGVAYTQRFDLPNLTGHYRVQLPKWHGSVAEVRVNDKAAGYIVSAPWECDVTDFLQPGVNEIQVVVIGTLRNTLGPHHNHPPLGRTWPNMFHEAPETGPPPGDDYATVGYGLFEPFVLQQVLK